MAKRENGKYGMKCMLCYVNITGENGIKRGHVRVTPFRYLAKYRRRNSVPDFDGNTWNCEYGMKWYIIVWK